MRAVYIVVAQPIAVASRPQRFGSQTFGVCALNYVTTRPIGQSP